MKPRHDALVLRLVRRQSLNALRATRVSTLVQLLALGGFFLAYFVAGLAADLRRAAPALRRLDAFWLFGLPVLACLLGAATGALIAGAAAARAEAPFLRALPLSKDSRRRAAAVAALVGTPAPAALFGLAIQAGCAVIEKPGALACAAVAFALFLAGGVAGVFARLRLAFQEGVADRPARAREKAPPFLLRRLDRARPAGLGRWSWGFVSRPLVPGLGAAFVVLAALAAGASLVQRQGAPAVIMGAAGGLILFMLTLRCDPLASPVLRAAPLGFTRAWAALLRFPLALAAVFYAGPAAAAVLAEPRALALPIGGGFILLALCAVYAVFAAFYGRWPGLAALSFCAALLYTAYESAEYGRPVLFAFAGLVALLWAKARGKYRHG